MEKFVKTLKKMSVIFICFGLLTVAISPSTARASTIWSELFTDNDGDFGVGYYADIDYFGLSTSDDSDDMIVIISAYYEASSTFFSYGGNGGVFFDTDGDSVNDIYVFAPSVTLSSTNFSNTYEIYRGANGEIATGCYSTWVLGSDLTFYGVLIPWRCLGAPASFIASAWLSNSVGYDFVFGDRTVYPTLQEVITTTVTWNVSSLVAGQDKRLSDVATTNSPGVQTWSKTGSCTLTPKSNPTKVTMGTGTCTLKLKIAGSGEYPAKTSSTKIKIKPPTSTTVTWKVSSLVAGRRIGLKNVASTNSGGRQTWEKTGSCTLTPESNPTTLTMGTGTCTLTLRIIKSGKYTAKTSTKKITIT